MSAAHGSCRKPQGTVLVLAMIFMVMFSVLAVAVAGLSGTNVQVASNQHRVNTALHAALSGLECAKYLVRTTPLGETNMNYVTTAQANQAWVDLCTHIRAAAPDGQAVGSPARFTDALGSGDELQLSAMDYGDGSRFTLRLYRYDSSPRTVRTQSIGADGEVSRRVAMSMDITKDREVLKYAAATRGRMWLTGETTIHGDVFSSWDRASISPFNMTSDTAVLGTVNTVLTRDQIDRQRYDLETLDADGRPISIDGGPLGEDYEDRYYGPNDEIQAYHEGIHYNQPYDNTPGMDISDHDTNGYTSGLTNIPTSSTVTEYFLHAAGNYTQPASSSSLRLARNVYENQTFTDASLPPGRQALFRNFTFGGVLFINCSQTSTSSTSYTNNVRFQDCTFNGVIVTNVPRPFNWMRNCLYFTGGATFNNQSSVQEATILAPHFNVNLGYTNPQQSDDNTNIGATLNDGGSETTELGDIGVIDITPEEDMMLPSGIMSPIIIKPDPKTYSEGV